MKRGACAPGAHLALDLRMRLSHRLGLLGAVVVAIGAFFFLAITPWYHGWGATSEERSRQLPGDEILSAPSRTQTRALTIPAPPERVWPWVAQLGQDRAGFYSFRLLENLVGARMPDAARLLPPPAQSWHLGDQLWMAPPDKFGGIGHADLLAFEPGRALAFATWVVPPRPGERKAPEGSWAFIVEPARDATQARLIVRSRTLAATSRTNLVFQRLFFEPLHFVMEKKMMVGIRERVAGRGPTPVGDAVQIAAWVVLFGLVLAAAVFLIGGRRRVARSVGALVFGALAFAALTLLQPGPVMAFLVAMVAAMIVPWRGNGYARRASSRANPGADPDPRGLDRFLPEAEFRGQVATWTTLPGAALMDAFERVTLDEMPLAALLGWLRYLPGRISGRRPAPSQEPARPFLGQLLDSGNLVLHRAPDEVIVGCIGKLHQLKDQQLVRLRSADEFMGFADPRHQKLAMSIRVERRPRGAARLVLEHRTHALGRGARRAFALYWIAIGPLGNFVSWLLLRAVNRRAARAAARGAEVAPLRIGPGSPPPSCPVTAPRSDQPRAGGGVW